MRRSNDIRKDLVRSLARPEVTLEKMESREGSIVSHWRITGRNVRGVPTLGIAPNGRTLDVRLITVDSVVDGIAHSRALIDLSGVMAQVQEHAEEPAAS
jgi:SnoaL-like polyketide cyclase